MTPAPIKLARSLHKAAARLHSTVQTNPPLVLDSETFFYVRRGNTRLRVTVTDVTAEEYNG